MTSYWLDWFQNTKTKISVNSELWNALFSLYKTKHSDEIEKNRNLLVKQFFESFYANYELIQVDSDPTSMRKENNPPRSLQALQHQQRNAVVYFVDKDYVIHFYEAKFDGSKNDNDFPVSLVPVPISDLEIFSKYSYAALTEGAQDEMNKFLESFYAGCQLLEVKLDPLLEDDRQAVKKLLNGRRAVVCFTGDEQPPTKKFYYVDHNSFNLEPIIAATEQQSQYLNNLNFAEPNTCRAATAEELKHIREVTDCMRFKTPAVLAIFDKRKSRKEALANSNALLDSLIPDEFQFYNAHQVRHLDESLRFALYQYIAQAQAATDHIGVIRSQHADLAACYRKIKLCTLYRKQLELRQLALDLQALERAQNANELDSISKLIDTYKTRYQKLGFSQIENSYKVLHDYQQNQQKIWSQYEALETLHRDLKRLKSAQLLQDHDTLAELFQKYRWHGRLADGDIEDLKSCIEKQRDTLKAILNNIDSSVESLKPEPLKSYLPSFLKEDEDQDDRDYLKSKLNETNARRLFWIWTRCVIEMLIISAHETLLASTMIAAWVSWSLYWLRGGIETAEAINHSFDISVSEREKVIQAHKRALAQWEERRDAILNDLVWGSSNFACCFWLTGVGVLGLVGDILTLALLGMDFALAFLRWINGRSAYEDTIQSYDAQLEELISVMLAQSSSLPSALLEKFQDLNQAYEMLRKARPSTGVIISTENVQQDVQEIKKARQDVYKLLAEIHAGLSDYRDNCLITNTDGLFVSSLHWQWLYAGQQAYLKQWRNKWANLTCDVAYATALAVGFGLMCFAPIAGLSLFGAVFLVASTMLWRAAYAKSDMASVARTIEDTEKQYDASLQHFIALADKFKPLSEKKDLASQEHLVSLDAQMKQLYLHIRALGAKVGYERELKCFKQTEFARDTFMRTVIPVSIALTLLLAPATVAAVPTYVFLLLGILVFALATSAAIHRYLKPKASAWQKGDDPDVKISSACFDEEEYLAFRRSVLVDVENEKLSLASKNQKADDVDTAPLLSPNSEPKALTHFDPKEGQARGQDLLSQMKTHRLGKNAKQMRLFSKTYFPEDNDAKDRDRQLGMVPGSLGA